MLGSACCIGGAILPKGFTGTPTALLASPGQDSEKEGVKEARHYEKLEQSRVKCKLCPRECSVADQERGYCGVRENRLGTYYTLVHSRPCAVHTDPIEKKPLFHFLPGSLAYSIATAGCNVECRFCQNWDISQFRPEQVRSVYLPPGTLHREASRTGARSIAYTYSEPVIFYEYMYDTAELGRETGVRSVMISNGYIQEKPMRELCQVLDAVKIDLKAFTEKFYKEYCSGELKPVLETLELLRKLDMWFEIVVLIIPTLNDSEDEIRSMSKWVATNLGKDIPIHFSRFHPTYKLKNLPVTPVRTLDMARRVAMEEGLNYAYVGNVWGHEGENTYCSGCGEIIIRRIGFRILEMNLNNGSCKYCGQTIPGVWS
ncbi:MAG: AmmeMemoRadiSam system radical SAM enzyme [Candidatus Glassbacteria bacterium]